MTKPALHSTATAKVLTRLVPLLMLVYGFNFLNRTNVAFAQSALDDAAGIGAAAYGLGSGIFFLSYALLQIPSNLLMTRVGPRRWIAVASAALGVISACLMFTSNAPTFYALRFLLGVAEAGIYPAILYLITLWFAKEDRTKVVGYVIVGAIASYVIGGPISGALMLLDGVGDLQGWQWLFLLEGIPSILVGIVIWYAMPDSPRDAKWLSAEEKVALTSAVEAGSAEEIKGSLLAGFRNPIILCLAAIFLINQFAGYGFAFFMPGIIGGMGVSGSLAIGIVTGLVSLASAFGAVVTPRLQRRYGRTVALMAVCMAGTAASAILYVLFDGPPVQFLALTLAVFFIDGTQPMIWSVAMERVSGTMAAGMLAFINTVGLIGGFSGPYVFGLAQEITGEPSAGFYALIASFSLLLILFPLLYAALRRSSSEASTADVVPVAP
ncbi:MFS transporter [Nocardia sp. NPDC055049]